MVEPVSRPGSLRALSGTAKPWAWTGWWRRELRDRYQQRRRARVRLHEIADLRDWRLRPRSPADETNAHVFYTPDNVRHIIRWEDTGRYPIVEVPTINPAWPVIQPAHVWKTFPGIAHIKLEPHPLPRPHPTSAPAPRTPAGWWEGAGRGLPLGAALLAAILLLLRVADRCLHTNLFKLPIRRRQSEEWPTPHVMATSLAVRMTSDYGSGRPASPSMQQCNEQVDLPPPYSECAAGTTDTGARVDVSKPDREEPPPPYSACYVAYSNPKDGPPSVHFLTRQCQNLFANYEAGPSNLDTGQTMQPDIDPVTTEVVDRLFIEDEIIREDRDVSDVHRVEVVQNVNAHEDSDVDAEEAKEVTSVPRDGYLVV